MDNREQGNSCRQSILALMRATGLYQLRANALTESLVGCEIAAYLVALEPLEQRICALAGASLLPKASEIQLRKFERMLAIPVKEQIPLEVRRKRALDKMALGTSDFHKAGILQALRSAGVDAILRENPGSTTVTIVVKGEAGSVLDLDEIKKAVQELLPAHLQADFQTGSVEWQQIDALDWNCLRLEAMGKNWNQLETTAIEEWGV